MLKYPLLFVLVALFGNEMLFAQQDAQYNQYMFNPLVINPAWAGYRNTLEAVVVHRSQWVGVKGAPVTQSVSVHAPVLVRNFGAGVSFVHDALGPTNSTEADINMSYRLKAGPGKLAFGLRTGAFNQRFDWSKIDYKDPDEIYAFDAVTTHWVPNFDFGLMYHSMRLYVAACATHLNEPEFGVVTASADSVFYTVGLAGHMNLVAGYAMTINPKWIFRPSVLLKTANASPALAMADVNVNFRYDKKWWFGLAYRSLYGVGLITEYEFDNGLRAGYSFDMPTNKLSLLNSAGSHELFIGYTLDLSPGKILSPRYF